MSEDTPQQPTVPTVGETVARWRFIRRLTQEQLAEASGLALVTIKSIERGARHPRMDTLNQIARALDVLSLTRY